VKRTVEKLRPDILIFSAVRSTDFVWAPTNPSDESLGYFQSSAKRGLKTRGQARLPELEVIRLIDALPGLTSIRASAARPA
jgi:hypothetical protein